MTDPLQRADRSRRHSVCPLTADSDRTHFGAIVLQLIPTVIFRPWKSNVPERELASAAGLFAQDIPRRLSNHFPSPILGTHSVAPKAKGVLRLATDADRANSMHAGRLA